MTDLEITRLCAEAMGIPTLTYEGLVYVEMNVRGQSGNKYDPLHDDAQAMALARKFPFEFESAVIEWCNHVRRNEQFDVIRYFCERIARMRSEP